MKQEIKKIIIKHLNGAKDNQIEEFDYKANDTISFGRGTQNQLQFDSEEDTSVSREHGSIAKGEKDGSFVITDNNSLNGTFVNGEKITGSQAIQPGDIITLGVKGPSFQFDTNPSLVDSAATQLVSIIEPDPTMEYSLQEAEPVKTGIGKETFEHAMVVERKRSQKTLFSIIGAIILIGAALGYSFKDSFVTSDELLASTDTITVVNNNTIVQEAFSPEKIAAENSDKVVFIEFGFKLTHAATGDDIYHQYTRQKDTVTGEEKLVPLFIETERGAIEPLLGLRKDVVDGAPIASSGATGTGFVVGEDGFILTNKHIAHPWKYPYHFPRDAQKGLLLQKVDGEMKIAGTVWAPQRWIPSESQFFGREPISGELLHGENTYMSVTFAKTDSRIAARVIQVSPNHDVAMIKIDHIAGFKPVELKEDGAEVAQGAKIAVMGYPGISPNVILSKSNKEFIYKPNKYKVVPDPTITDGTIGKIIRGTNLTNNAENNKYISFFGEYYQLTASETGAGNSGGPVFDKDGKVIAIFAASKNERDGARLTFAIPIKYGLDLMHLTKVIQ